MTEPKTDEERKIDVVCIGCGIRLTDEYQLGVCDQVDGPVCSMCDESRRGAVPIRALGRWLGGKE